MWVRGPRSMDRALPWRATCSDSANTFLAGRWWSAFIRGFAMNESFPARTNCGDRSRGILLRRRSILRSTAKRRMIERGVHCDHRAAPATKNVRAVRDYEKITMEIGTV